MSNFSYWISGNFAAGAVITQAPNDSGVTSFIGTIDPKTGYITPFAIGFGKAIGMIFEPNASPRHERAGTTWPALSRF